MKSKRFGMIVVSAVAGALVLTACNGEDAATGAGAGAAAGSPAADGHASAGSEHAAGGGTVQGAGRWDKNKEDATFFSSVLSGANEVPVEGGPTVGDKDGHALALMRIQGDQVSYAFTFTGIGTPTLGHLHKGVKGVNGDVKIPFFTKKLEDGKKFVYGTVTVDDQDLLKGIRANAAELVLQYPHRRVTWRSRPWSGLQALSWRPRPRHHDRGDPQLPRQEGRVAVTPAKPARRAPSSA